MNRAFLEISGYTRDEVLSDSRWIFALPEAAPLAGEMHRRVIAGESVHFELKARRKDGRLIDVEMRAVPIRYRGKPHALVVVAEGARLNAAALMKHFESNRGRLGFDMRATTLGHVQRGGAPGAFDRLLATRMSAGAIERLARGEFGCMVGFAEGQVKSTPLETVVNTKKPIDLELLKLARVLAA